MIVDGRGSDVPATEYDLAIVGAGPAGVTLAMECEGAGLRVALLEGGGDEFDPEAQALYDGTVTGLEEVDLLASRLRMLGGTSNHWGGYCLPMDEADFARRPLGGLTGWPFARAALDPFYARAHPYLRLGEYEYGTFAPQGVAADDLLLAGDGRVENSVLRLSSHPPANFNEEFRDRLAASADVDLWLHTNLVGIDVGPDGTVTGLRTRTLDGTERRFAARRVVLACGAVETARQLMLMNADAGTRFGDAGGLLGACYMDHPAGGAAFLHPDAPLPPMANWSHELRAADGTETRYVWRLNDDTLLAEGLANAQFYLIPFSTDDAARQRAREAGAGMNGLRTVAKWALGREGAELSQGYCAFVTNADAMVAEAFAPAGTVDRVLLKYEAEQSPSRDSRIRLTDARDRFGQPLPELHWAPTEDDKLSLIRTTELIGQSVGAAGLGRLEFEEGRERRWWNFVTSWHQLGTTRMSEGPSDGVVDPDGRVHGTTNLYVAGGGAFPTGGRANPTLTILALTIRLADHLKSRPA